MDSGLWSNLLRKTAIETTFYFPAEKKKVCKRKKSVSVNSTSHNHDQAFCNTHSDFHMEKTDLVLTNTVGKDGVRDWSM